MIHPADRARERVSWIQRCEVTGRPGRAGLFFLVPALALASVCLTWRGETRHLTSIMARVRFDDTSSHIVNPRVEALSTLRNSNLRVQKYFMISGPSQGSTWMSTSMLRGLGLFTNDSSLHRSCPPEALNPSCHNLSLATEYSKCFASDEWSQQIWATCSDVNWTSVLSTYHSTSSTFTKDNFANGWHLQRLHEAGFKTFLFFRSPCSTFPLTPRSQPWWPAIWRRFVTANPSDLVKLPFGRNLTVMQEYFKQNEKLYDLDQMNCLAHYMHFWHLISVAEMLGLPWIKMESLHGVDSEHVVHVLCEKLKIDSVSCSKLRDSLYKRRNIPIHLHNVSNAVNFSYVALEANKRIRYATTGCALVLDSAMHFCETKLDGCARINMLYAGKDIHNSKTGRCTR